MKTINLKDFVDFNGKDCKLRGRIIAKRDCGSLIFLRIADFYGSAQISLSKEHLLDLRPYKHLKRGDIVSGAGFIYHTTQGEKTLQITDFKVITISKLGLPSGKWHGLTDEEKSQSLRYITVVDNEEVRQRFINRFKIINAITEFFVQRGYQHVDTPILCPIASGAAANPFQTHHDALDWNMYLRIAPELYLKRYMIAGMEKCFEIAKCFRNEGIDPTHLQEFTQVEAYEAYISYDDLMTLSENLLKSVVHAVSPNMMIGNISFNDIPRIKYEDFIRQYVGIEKKDWFNEPLLREIANKHNIDIKQCRSTVAILDKLYKKLGLSHISDPIILYDYYKSPLAKINPQDPLTSNQFQIILKHQEVLKGCLEMIDPDEQKKNFEEQMLLAADGEEDAVRMDNSFIEALEFGAPEMGGLGLGIDRITTILTESSSIRDVIMFPMIKKI
jgi:lysyl-tRNA synthetase class 2